MTTNGVCDQAYETTDYELVYCDRTDHREGLHGGRLESEGFDIEWLLAPRQKWHHTVNIHGEVIRGR